jgi:hypothetical protein
MDDTEPRAAEARDVEEMLDPHHAAADKPVDLF